MKDFSKFGALALLEKLNTIIFNQEKTMAAIDDLRAAHAALTAKVAELTSTTAASLTAIAADVTYLRNQIASGTVTADDVAKAAGAVTALQSAIDALKAFDAVPENPPSA
jgi:predicted RecB family endonuclease